MTDGSRGTLYILTGPSRVGKTSIVKEVLRRLPDLRATTTYTSRPPREHGHEDKVMLHISREEFQEKADHGDFLEWNEHHGDLYGTSAKETLASLGEGHSVLLNIDIKGTKELLHTFPGCIAIGVLPDNADVLLERQSIRTDATDDAKRRRIDDIAFEMEETKTLPHTIVNATGKLDETIDAIVSFITTGRF